MRITIRSGAPPLTISLHGGAIRNRSPASTGRQFCFHSASQSRAATSLVCISRTDEAESE
jgi:hypothetical protein